MFDFNIADVYNKKDDSDERAKNIIQNLEFLEEWKNVLTDNNPIPSSKMSFPEPRHVADSEFKERKVCD